MYLKKTITQEDLDNMRISLSVQQRRLREEPSCDFCGDSNPLFVYAAYRMSTGEWRSNWRWCACEDCSLLIDQNDLLTVRHKVVLWLKKRSRFKDVSDEVLKHAATAALSEFILYAKGLK